MNFRQATRLSLCALIFAAILPGFARFAGAEPDSLDPYDTVEKNVRFLDATLNNKLAVTRVGAQPGKDGLLSVFAGFQNKTSRRLALDIETIYKDAADRALNSESWIPMTIDAGEAKDYRSSSISDEAVGFVIQIRNHHHAK